jgi:hypothetical protein
MVLDSENECSRGRRYFFVANNLFCYFIHVFSELYLGQHTFSLFSLSFGTIVALRVFHTGAIQKHAPVRIC